MDCSGPHGWTCHGGAHASPLGQTARRPMQQFTFSRQRQLATQSHTINSRVLDPRGLGLAAATRQPGALLCSGQQQHAQSNGRVPSQHPAAAGQAVRSASGSACGGGRESRRAPPAGVQGCPTAGCMLATSVQGMPRALLVLLQGTVEPIFLIRLVGPAIIVGEAVKQPGSDHTWDVRFNPRR